MPEISTLADLRPVCEGCGAPTILRTPDGVPQCAPCGDRAPPLLRQVRPDPPTDEVGPPIYPAELCRAV
jgi:hypothetical protein